MQPLWLKTTWKREIQKTAETAGANKIIYVYINIYKYKRKKPGHY